MAPDPLARRTVVPVSEPTTDPTVPEGGTPADGAAVESAAVESAAADATSSDASFGRHPIVIYTLKRLLLLMVVGGLLYLVGLRGLFLILFAFLISGVIAMVALKGSREGAAYGITHAVQKVNDRIDASTRAEDYDDLDDDLVETSTDAAAADPSTDSAPDEPRA